MTWMLTRCNTDNYVKSIVTFSKQILAETHGCATILDYIRNEWDLSDVDRNKKATKFNDFLTRNEYENAIEYWNDECAFLDAEANYWHVDERHDRQTAWTPHLLTPQELGHSVTYANVTPTVVKKIQSLTKDDFLGVPVWKPTSSGATCRGPCKQYNEYATADKQDCTYICKGCQMMSSVFGGTIK